MENSIVGFAKTTASLFVIVAVCVGLAGIAYQLFAPDGLLFLWIEHLWKSDPLRFVLLGAVCILIKRWMDGIEHSTRLADAMIYLAALAGILFGINLLAG